MAAEEKSESINFDNEQIEQKTLNSNEERQIKKSQENKTRRNKSQSRLIKTRFPNINQHRKQKIYQEINQTYINSFNAGNQSNENEEFIPEIKIAKKDIKYLNKELKNLKDEYFLMEEQNLTYKYMIEKILNSKFNKDINKENNNNNDIIEENEENNDDNSKKKKINKKKKIKLMPI